MPGGRADGALLAPTAPHGCSAAGTPPALSVVIAAWNAEATIRETISSVLVQRPAVDELIVVDDGSTDATATVASAFGESVRVLRREHAGEAAAKNAGARAAGSDVVAYVDADDVLLPGWTAAVSAALQARPDLDLVTTDAWLVHHGRRLRRCYSSDYVFVVDGQRHAMINDNFVLGLCAVRRGRLLESGGFDESVAVTSDWSAWLSLALGGGRFGCVPEVLAEYRLHPRGLSYDLERLLQGGCEVLERAATMPSLNASDREALHASLERRRHELELMRLRRGLIDRTPDARARAAAVAGNGTFRVPTRLKALAAAVLPFGVSRRFAVRGDRRAVDGARPGHA